MQSGTFVVDRKKNIFRRLCEVFAHYRDIVDCDIDEVHIEQLVRNTHIYTHWSVAVIGIALYLQCGSVDANIPIQSWQKHNGWRKAKGGVEVGKVLETYRKKVSSEDELAAIGMGLFWVNNRI
jgi:hypothetical protein